MKKNRWVWAGAIVVAVLVLLSLVVAPNRANLHHGSTYSRAPSGYGAWYAYMQEQGVNIQRWQRPLEDLIQPSQSPENPIEEKAVPIGYQQFLSPILSAASVSSQSPITLLQVDNRLGGLGLPPQQWIERGNIVIQLGGTRAVEGLGIEFPVTRSPFTSVLSSSAGGVKIETSRRFTELQNLPNGMDTSIESRLADAYGAVVLKRAVGKGKIITAITPYLAANAYQDELGNFKFLEQLVTEAGNPIWVDEYLHGYKDQEIIAEETSQNLLKYLVNTPISLVAVQAIVLLLVLIWGLNRRLGPPMALASPKVDNSEAYIQALASVLRQANCSEFVVQTIGKAEQLQVQRSLGLGNDLLDPAIITEAWVQQTGRSSSDLEDVLNYTDRHRFSETELWNWLGKVQRVRQQLP